MRPNSLLGIVRPKICLIDTNSIKSNDGRDESKSHPNNEHLASRQHDLVQTGLECNIQDIPALGVQSLNAKSRMKHKIKSFASQLRFG